ncbi:hypothetical protein VTK73DRAFT_6185 [Phialemonium thermophilum]|uniref:Uncharacterized protein n=1 Tax=Phialemonium thermophilum TaxID=223376 RepID=A0ABR3UZW1_9PEZI
MGKAEWGVAFERVDGGWSLDGTFRSALDETEGNETIQVQMLLRTTLEYVCISRHVSLFRILYITADLKSAAARTSPHPSNPSKRRQYPPFPYPQTPKTHIDHNQKEARSSKRTPQTGCRRPSSQRRRNAPPPPAAAPSSPGS